MNLSSDIGTTAGATAGIPAPPDPQPYANWRKALAGLLSSRIGLLRIESSSAGRTIGKRIACLAIAAFCAFFTWVLLIAGSITLIASSTGWAWGWIALAAAGLHILVAGICVVLAKSAGNPPFPVTRAELKKDLEWLQTLQTKNSND